MFLVTGITGHVGGATAQNLLEQGHEVRALVRNPEKASAWAERGVELIPGDLSDAAAIASALAGVEGAYIMLPPTMAPQPGFPEARAVIASYVEALRRAAPPRLVVLSSIGSEKPHGLGLITGTHLLEEALEAEQFGFPIALIRAGSFFDNTLPSVPVAAQTGHFYTFNQPVDRAVQSIATADIGALAARLLTGDAWSGRRVVELGSPYSPAEFAQAIGRALGKPVAPIAVPREQWTAALEQFGFPKGGTAAYEEMVDGVNSGWISFGVDGAERIPGTVGLDEFFAAHRASA